VFRLSMPAIAANPPMQPAGGHIRFAPPALAQNPSRVGWRLRRVHGGGRCRLRRRRGPLLRRRFVAAEPAPRGLRIDPPADRNRPSSRPAAVDRIVWDLVRQAVTPRTPVLDLGFSETRAKIDTGFVSKKNQRVRLRNKRRPRSVVEGSVTLLRLRQGLARPRLWLPCAAGR
jgi:hypothetical protein